VARLPENHAEALNALEAGRPALVWRRMIADTETPVGAAAKLIVAGRGDFLLESVEGGEVRGRYSLLGIDPDRAHRRRSLAERAHAPLSLNRSPRRRRNSGGGSPPGTRTMWSDLNSSGTSACASGVSSMQTGSTNTPPSAMLRARSTA